MVQSVGPGVPPGSWQGIVLVLLALVFCVQVCIAGDRHSHSASDTRYGIFPHVVPCLILLNRPASKTSEPPAMQG